MLMIIGNNIYSNELNVLVSDRKTIAELRENIVHNFSKCFEYYGFKRHSAGNLIPEYDKSVLFTGSTISTFKVYLKSSIPSSGFYMIQSCLRSQNTKIIEDDSINPWGASYFLSMGAITNYNKLELLSEQVWIFFTQYLSLTQDRLRIRASSQDLDLINYWQKVGLEKYLELDANPPSYYKHKFGMEGIIGRNCNLAIVDNNSGLIRDIGNIIVIEEEGKPIGVEIAFGVETVLSRILGFSNPILASLIADIVPMKSNYSIKFGDAISSTIAILKSGVRPVVTNRGRILRTYLQGISYLRHKVNASVNDIAKYAQQFETKEFGEPSTASLKISDYINKYEELRNMGLSPEKVNKGVSNIFS